VKRVHECCRICHSTSLRKFFRIADLPMPEGHTEKGVPAFSHDLEIFWCENCFMVQTQIDLNLEEYYTNYAYTTGHSAHVNRYMGMFADELISQLSLDKGNLIVEVGSGDGLQLQSFKKRGFPVVGIEPSAELAKQAKNSGIPTIQALFDNYCVDRILDEHGKAKCLIIQYTFDHLQDPSAFMEDCSRLISEDGFIIIEVHDFEKILKRNEACLFTHEHSVYPSTLSITELFKRNNFQLVGNELMPQEFCRGNSIIFIGGRKSSIRLNVVKSEIDLTKGETYADFSNNVSQAHKRLNVYVTDKVKSGFSVAGYGAAGRGVDTCVLANLNGGLIKAVYDLNASFHGRYTPISDIIVKDPSAAFIDQPDVMIVFSYGYIEEISEYYRALNCEIVSMLDIMNGEQCD